MNRFTAVPDTFRVPLGVIADWLFGCSHRRTTFPMTLRASISSDGQQSTQAGTYVMCLECGRRFAYDWTAMRVTRQRAAWARGRPGLGRISDKNDVSRGERVLPQAVTLGLLRE